ncbi:MAG: rhamnan synthesis F family protein [Rhodobacterales bacterium]
MSKIPFWKIKRELHRLRREGGGFLRELPRKLYFRRYYDLVSSKAIRRTKGKTYLKREVAIYLIFPENGVLESHIFMLRELQRDGIDTVVVSNLPLTDNDRDRLLETAARIIERPNVGYDFGGYRDGMLDIAGLLPDLDRVWLLNDSVWMVSQSISWFAQARALNKDFTGATSSFSILRKTLWGARRFDATDYRNIVWRHQPENRNFHYGSYALCIGKAILQDPRFLDYWRKLEIRNGKKHTVRRGEIGLSQWALRHGYSHGATHEIDRLPQELAKLSDAELDQTARELILFKDTALAGISPSVLLTDTSSVAGRAERMGLILTAVARHGSAYALALYNLRHTTFPFLKKSPLWLSSDGPASMLKLAEDISTPPTAHIAAEAHQLCDRLR